MNLIKEIAAVVEANTEWSEIVSLSDRFEVMDELDPARRVTAGRVADLLEAYADRMRRSRVARAWASSFTAEALDLEAAEWRKQAAR